MDGISIYMEKKFRYYYDFKRQFNSSLPVVFAGVINGKDYQTNFNFKLTSYSFIDRGRGYMRVNGKKTYEIKAPCMLMQYPGAKLEYGPCKGETWDEIFFSYKPDANEYLQWKGYFPEKEFPAWEISSFDIVSRLMSDFRRVFNTDESLFSLNRFDLLCESLILESLINDVVDQEGSPIRVVKAICAELKNSAFGHVDLGEFAEKFKISPSTLRRYWQQYVGVPPGQYRAEQLMREACYMLMRTDKSIKEIARQLHYDDQLYFSKKFKTSTGLSPSQYRLKYTSTQYWPE